MQFAELTSTSRRIGATRARLEKTALLAGLLRRLAPDEIVPAVVVPLGAAAPGADRTGSRGGARGDARGRVRCRAVAHDRRRGRGVHEDRRRLGGGLDGRAPAPGSARCWRGRRREERDILVRLMLGELRQGALEGLMAEALANAAGDPAGGGPARRDARGRPRRRRARGADRRTRGPRAFPVSRCSVLSSRCSPSRPTASTTRWGGSARPRFEYKLDGARVQVHRSDDEVRVFTRGLNDVTAAVPELVEAVRALPARELILDGEVLALRPDGAPHPFQTTMRRFGRKLDVDALRGELPLTPFFFDVLRRRRHRPASMRRRASARARSRDRARTRRCRAW